MYYDERKLKTYVQNQLIDKKFVHKKEEKNVLLFNLRRALPKWIAKTLFERILAGVAEEDKRFICRYYTPHNTEELEFIEENGDPVYILSSYPLVLPGDVLEAENVTFPDVAKIIKEHYRKDETRGQYILTVPLKDIDHFRILTVLKIGSLYIPSHDAARLSGLFETYAELPKEEIFYSNIHVNPLHEYFFEHNIEHIPAMMLIEAQRQFGLACGHIYGKVPMEGMQIILKKLNINFNIYAELVYPVVIRGENSFTRWKHKRYWGEIHMDIGIYQNTEVANFSFVGKSVEIRMFERFRERKYCMMNRHRFAPHPYIDYNFSLKGSSSRQYLEVSLQDISSGGFSVLFPAGGDTDDANTQGIYNEKACDFLIYSKAVGFISGKCEKVWEKESPTSRYVGYRFVDLPENDDHRIKEFISKFFYQIEKREYFKQRCRG
jgi:hypothetical protein